jgi:hypothetical protein
MPLYADRVKDSTTITGTGAITLANSAPTGFQTFATAFGSSTITVAYCIVDQTGNNWEVGTGVFNGTTGLTRANVLGSSDSGSLVNFTSGTKDVFCTVPAKYLEMLPSAVNTAGQYLVSLSNNSSNSSWRNRVTKSTTAPSNPIEGDTWLDTSTGSWSMYLQAGDGVVSNGWVEIGRP